MYTSWDNRSSFLLFQIILKAVSLTSYITLVQGIITVLCTSIVTTLWCGDAAFISDTTRPSAEYI